ncbi:MAG: glycosyltransferase family 39 protein [Saprospiraceae bacterium]|nr:glycosyltransferase family 39 protein [Saprospiraceae bacterium]
MKFSTASPESLKRGRRLMILFFISASLLLFFSELVEKSMFIDGVWYAVISRNLAEGVGSFWFPRFSETIFPNFHEHPPFIFGLQSAFFGVLGDHWFTERLFSLCHYLATGLLIARLWRKGSKSWPLLRSYWILPLLLWQVNLVTYYFQPANLLDASISLIGLASIWCMWQGLHHRGRLGWLALAGFMLVAGFLSKGVVALYPLAFIPLYGWICRGYSFRQIFLNTAWVGTSFALLLWLLISINPLAYESLSRYVDIQLLASLKGERRLYYYRSNRFYIVIQLLWVLVPMILLLLASYVAKRWMKLKIKAEEQDKLIYTHRLAYTYFALGLSASLPIMISPRQAIPYLLPSIPFFSLAFAWWAGPSLVQFLLKWQQEWRWSFKVTRGGAWLAVMLGLAFCALKIGDMNGRDAAVIQDSNIIGQVVGENQTISSTTYNMYISGYLMRYDKISIDTTDTQHAFLLSKKDEPIKQTQYVKIPLPTLEYDLYQRKLEEHSFSQHTNN